MAHGSWLSIYLCERVINEKIHVILLNKTALNFIKQKKFTFTILLAEILSKKFLSVPIMYPQYD
jgi:hypothetical protein